MLVLDTNHIREMALGTPLGRKLIRRLDESKLDAVTTIVTVEECLRGWMSRLASAHDVAKQVGGYAELDRIVHFLGELTFLPWDGEAAQRFKALRREGLRIGSADLKIACITLEHEAVLLTRNTRDFAQVPGLRQENWLDDPAAEA